MLHTIIFIGRSGCGKGTQADLLKNRINSLDPDKRQILYIETGDHFRRFVRGENLSSRTASETNNRDERQPDFLACWMWSNILINELDDNMHIVFDGAPRSLPEAKVMSTAMQFYKRERPTVIHLDVSRKWSEDRLLSRGRADDLALSKINKRLDWYDSEVVPAVDYLSSDPAYKFIRVSGEQSVDKVHADIIAEYGY
jgi:adenylate kinase